MKLTDTVQRRPDLVAADMDGSTVMLDVKSGKYYNLTGPGGMIWEELAQPVLISDLIRKLTGSYQVSEEDCEKSTLRFLEGLDARGLLNRL